jgi:flagellar FliL protein
VSLELIETEPQASTKEEGPSLVKFLVVIVVITVIAGGAGFGVSATILKPVALTSAGSATHEAETETATAHGSAHGSAGGHGVPAEHAEEAGAEQKKLVVVDIPSITTNLHDPTDAWIRMELSLVFEDASDQAMAEAVHQDILAYVHTMKLYNLRGGSGYQHLIEDLQDRAAIRTEGRVKRVLVRSLILE